MMFRFLSTRRRDERGTVAIIAAISSVVLFGIGAMAVDLGNAFARARDVQASADFAAIAGGRYLPGPATNSPANDTAKAVIAVADYLNKNQPLDQDAGACQQSHTCVTAADLVDGNYDNGEVVFLDDGYKMKVYAPRALVKFGLAKVIGVSSTNLLRDAEVGVYSPAAALPFYVGEACSWGQQQVVDPPPSNTKPSNNPTLTPSSDNFSIKNLSIDPTYISQGGPGDPPPTITVFMSDTLKPADYDTVGFSVDGGSTTYTVNIPADSDYENAPVWSHDTVNGLYALTVTLPSTVYQTENYYYVRLHKAGSGPNVGWSRPSNPDAVLEVDAPNFAIGSSCSSVNQGNFGSLFLPRDDATDVNTTLALNTIESIQHSLGIHPNPSAALADSPQCADNPSIGSVRPIGPPDPGVVDCVSTDTGNPQTATEGLVTGITDSNGVFHKGLLDASVAGHETTCNANGTTADRSMPSLPSVNVNDDVLTCFYTDQTSSVTLGQISSPSYSGPQVIGPEIFQSPRFVFLPVLTDDPNRGSKYWPIITFRAAFITGQDAYASPTNPEANLVNSNDNGLVWQKQKQQGLKEMHVVLINNNALPEIAQAPGDVIRYLGVGTKVIRLID